jgi:cobalt-precorrin-5B (C1)-methyltransferase
VKTTEPELSPDVAARTTGLRTGWTTGTCASAAAKAAATGLVSGAAPATVDVALPGGQRVTFPVEPGGAPNVCVVVKDAGDDPDCTDGARMTATVEWAPAGADEPVELRAGSGIGTVTKPGLGLTVGGPAINPVPRRMITQAIGEVTDRPVIATFSVPGGEEMAVRTSNLRLGIVGGISILGTTGVVRPFSTAAYRASVVQQVDVAAAQGEKVMVLATGSRSEASAMRLLPEIDPVCVVEVGDFTGIALRHAAAAGMTQAIFVGMAGKIAKLAAGVMMTHFHRSKVDTDLLAEVAIEAGAPQAVVEAATETNTARHFYDACMSAGTRAPLTILCKRAKRACEAHANGALSVDIIMVDFDGAEVVARA